jgi:hypothetical protein
MQAWTYRDLDTKWRWVVCLMLQLLYLWGKSHSCAAGGNRIHPVALSLYPVFCCSICSWKVAVTNRRNGQVQQDATQHDTGLFQRVTAVSALSILGINAPTSNSKGKGKGKVHPETHHEDPEVEWRYSSTLSLTSALDGVGGRHAQAALPPENTWYPLYRRLGGPQGQSRRVRKISRLPGFGPRTVRHVASRYNEHQIVG